MFSPPFNRQEYHNSSSIGITKATKCGRSHLCKIPLLRILGLDKMYVVWYNNYIINNKAVIFMNELDNNFHHIADIITNAREQALRKVNEELVLMYWNIG